jgi:hypothetical protein
LAAWPLARSPRRKRIEIALSGRLFSGIGPFFMIEKKISECKFEQNVCQGSDDLSY